MPKTVRNVRVDDSLWYAAMRRARDEGSNVSEVINRALSAYVEGTSGEDEQFLRVVAALTILFDDTATDAIVKHFGCSKKVAQGYIQRARDDGLLV